MLYKTNSPSNPRGQVYNMLIDQLEESDHISIGKLFIGSLLLTIIIAIIIVPMAANNDQTKP